MVIILSVKLLGYGGSLALLYHGYFSDSEAERCPSCSYQVVAEVATHLHISARRESWRHIRKTMVQFVVRWRRLVVMKQRRSKLRYGYRGEAPAQAHEPCDGENLGDGGEMWAGGS